MAREAGENGLPGPGIVCVPSLPESSATIRMVDSLLLPLYITAATLTFLRRMVRPPPVEIAHDRQVFHSSTSRNPAAFR